MSESIVDRVSQAIDIVELIGEYVELRRSGKSYKGLCPFHEEKTPSFFVSPDKGVYHCFGCGASGNIFTFIMEIEKVDFPDALRILAERAGVPLGEMRKPSPFYNLMELSVRFYQALLYKEEGKKALNYLRERGFRLETIKRFNIGYAPSTGDSLFKHLMRKGYRSKDLIDAGLVLKTEKGKIVDYFRDRIIFPIRNQRGLFVGMGGRALANSQEPKYINSPDTNFFKKGELLYGLSEAKEAIRKKEVALLVEGYTDLIALFEYGYENVVAPLGTALTEAQASLLSRFARKVYLLYDGDEAGLRATRRAILVLLKKEIESEVVLLPKGEDPESYLRKEGKEGMENLLKKREDSLFFLLREMPGASVSYEERMREVLSQIKEVGDSIRRHLLLKKLSQISGIALQELKMEMEKLRERRSPVFKDEPLVSELCYLVRAFFDNELREKVVEKIKEDYLKSDVSREFLSLMGEGKKKDEIMIEASDKLRKLFTHILVDELLPPKEEVEDWVERLLLRKEISLHREALRRAEKEGLDEDVKRHLSEIERLKFLLNQKEGV